MTLTFIKISELHDFGVVSGQRAVILYDQYLQVSDEFPNEFQVYLVLACVYLSSKITTAQTVPLSHFVSKTISNSQRLR